MNIVIEARALSASQGVRVYVHELITHLLKKYPPSSFNLIYDAPKHSKTFPQTHEVVLPLRHELLLLPWLWRDVPSLLTELQPEIVHFTKAAIPRRKYFPTIVTIYDIIPMLLPSSQQVIKRWYWPYTLRHAAAQSDHVITISQASKRDICHYLNIPPDKVTVTPLAIDHNHFQPSSPLTQQRTFQKYGITKPYILCVSTLEPRKNILTLLKAFAKVATQTQLDLVIVGKKGWKYEEVLKYWQESPHNKRIHFLEYVPYADLPDLYSGADLFVWPSVYEGWGLPVLEAMACGTPVVVSDGGSLPEVVGTAAEIVPFREQIVAKRFMDHDFERDLTDRIIAVVTNDAKKSEMRIQGLKQAALFSWSDVAEKTMAVYKKNSR